MAGGIIGPLSNLLNTDYNSMGNNASQGVVIPENKKPDEPRVIENAGETTKKQAGRRSSPAECETCKHRKYQDGSDEGNVSFKTASHISPASAGAKVRAHEQEHVSNAYSKAAQNNGKVISAVVSLHTDICPECGRSYVSGGTTNTRIKYFGDNNGYHKGIDAANADKYNGANVDFKG